MTSIPTIHLYDSLQQKKILFKPLNANQVRIYVCGITVYDYCHMGHARLLTAFDVIVRFLRASGYEVTYTRNITDIDDKIIQRAHQNGETVNELTARFIDAMNEDCRALNLLTPDLEPRATEHIPQIITLIEKLIAKDLAYLSTNGDVYYAVRHFPEYGKLSHKDIDGLPAGARVEIGDSKRDPLDFVLWKSAKPGEPSWPSPWGAGRPGWHIECSAMSMHCLGEQFDLHGGGFDLLFPHHENEIAQSEGATGQQCVNHWLHNGFVQIDGEKMSKSLNNFFTLREVLNQHAPEVVRYFLISSHYRTQINYSDVSLHNAKDALTRFYTALNGLPDTAVLAGDEYRQRFNHAMADDFNTPVALAALFDLVREINRVKETDIALASALAAQLKACGAILGILTQDPLQFLQTLPENSAIDVARIEALIAARKQARANKAWAEADTIRDELTALGITLEDKSGQTVWRRGDN